MPGSKNVRRDTERRWSQFNFTKRRRTLDDILAKGVERIVCGICVYKLDAIDGFLLTFFKMHLMRIFMTISVLEEKTTWNHFSFKKYDFSSCECEYDFARLLHHILRVHCAHIDSWLGLNRFFTRQILESMHFIFSFYFYRCCCANDGIKRLKNAFQMR